MKAVKSMPNFEYFLQLHILYLPGVRISYENTVKFVFISYLMSHVYFSAIGDLDDFGNLPSISEKDIEKLRKSVEKTKIGNM